MLEIKDLSKKMAKDILKSVGKENDPVLPLIELYIEKQLQKIVNNF